MTDEDPDLMNDIAAIIHKVTGNENVMVEGYTLVASYSCTDEELPQLFTWWPSIPKWKLLGMAEGLSEILRIELRHTYKEDN